MRSPDGVLFDFGGLEGNDCCCHLGLSSPCSSSVHESREVPPPAEEPGVGKTRASSAHESFSTPVPAAPWSKRRRARPRQEELKRLVRTNCQPGCTFEADVKLEAAAQSEAVEELELVDGEIIAGHNVAVLREEYGKFLDTEMQGFVYCKRGSAVWHRWMQRKLCKDNLDIYPCEYDSDDDLLPRGSPSSTAAKAGDDINVVTKKGDICFNSLGDMLEWVQQNQQPEAVPPPGVAPPPGLAEHHVEIATAVAEGRVGRQQGLQLSETIDKLRAAYIAAHNAGHDMRVWLRSIKASEDECSQDILAFGHDKKDVKKKIIPENEPGVIGDMDPSRKYLRIRNGITMDSGCSVFVVPSGWLHMFALEESVGSRNGQA